MHGPQKYALDLRVAKNQKGRRALKRPRKLVEHASQRLSNSALHMQMRRKPRQKLVFGNVPSIAISQTAEVVVSARAAAPSA